MIILISYIELWVLIYYIEGTHDSFLTKEVGEHPQAKDYVKANYYKGRWHVWDSYQFTIIHIGFALLFALLRQGNENIFSSYFLLLTFSLITISVSIRMIAHDFFYDLGVNRKPFSIPTCQGKWDFWDCWIVKLNNLHPVLPFVLRFAPITTTTIVYVIFFI